MDLYRLLKLGHDDHLKIGASLARSRQTLQSWFPHQPVKTEEMNDVVVIFTELVELHFFNDRLINLVIKIFGCSRKDELRLGEGGAHLTRATSLGAVVRWLHQAGIEWRVYQPLSDGKVVTLLTESGATIESVAEADRMLINRIHLTEGLERNR